MAWMRTFTGKRFDPFDPDPANIDIDDTAWALSNICRFGGHSSRFYSVAEHSVLVGEHLFHSTKGNRRLALAGLLHDATEAYLGDVPRPLKYRPEFAFYREAEAKLEAAIFHKFGLNEFVCHPEIKRVDNAILADEAQQLMGDPGESWGLTEPPLGITLPRGDRPIYWFNAFMLRFGDWAG
jgi:hypothetical protein